MPRWTEVPVCPSRTVEISGVPVLKDETVGPSKRHFDTSSGESAESIRNFSCVVGTNFRTSHTMRLDRPSISQEHLDLDRGGSAQNALTGM